MKKIKTNKKNEQEEKKYLTGSILFVISGLLVYQKFANPSGILSYSMLAICVVGILYLSFFDISKPKKTKNKNYLMGVVICVVGALFFLIDSHNNPFKILRGLLLIGCAFYILYLGLFGNSKKPIKNIKK